MMTKTKCPQALNLLQIIFLLDIIKQVEVIHLQENPTRIMNIHSRKLKLPTSLQKIAFKFLQLVR